MQNVSSSFRFVLIVVCEIFREMFHPNLLSLVKIRPVGAPQRDQHSFPLSLFWGPHCQVEFWKDWKKNPFALTCFQCHLCNVFLFFIVFSLPHIIRMLREKTLQIWTVHRRKFRCDKPRVVFTEISTINLICFCYLQKAETEKQVKTIVQNILLLLLQKASHAEAEDDLRSIINFCR